MRTEFQTDTQSGSQCPYHSKVCRISLIGRSPEHLWIEATRLDFLLEPSRPTLDPSEEEVKPDSQLCTSFTQKNIDAMAGDTSHIQ